MKRNDTYTYARSSKLFAAAKKVIPGGVNSPVRAFKSVGGEPIFIEKAKGAYLYDCLLYTSPSPRDAHESRMPSSA